MKNHLTIALLAALAFMFGFAPASAQANLPNILDLYLGRTGQTAAVSATQVGGSGNQAIPVSPAAPLVPSGSGCQQTLTPVGLRGQTILCDGNNWVAQNRGDQWADIGNNAIINTNSGPVYLTGSVLQPNSGANNFFGGRIGIGVPNNDSRVSLGLSHQIKIQGGNPGLGKVLTSDEDGLASWETSAGGGDIFWQSNGRNISNANLGYVGIGTESPTDVLQVVSAGSNSRNGLTVQGGTSASLTNQGVLTVGSMGGGGGIVKSWLVSKFNPSISDYGFFINTDDDTRPVVLQSESGGRVGIGINNPTQKLEVAGNIRATDVCTTGNRCLSSIGGGGVGGSGQSGYLPKWNSGTQLSNSSVFENLGRVGVGTATPLDQLHVIRPGQGVSGGITIQGGTAGSPSQLNEGKLTLSVVGLGGGAAVGGTVSAKYNASSNDYGLTIASPSLVALQPTGGNVGIGTSNPTQKLEVNGAIKLASMPAGMPACNESLRGVMYFQAGRNESENDHLYFCLRHDGVYNWQGGE